MCVVLITFLAFDYCTRDHVPVSALVSRIILAMSLCESVCTYILCVL